MKIYSKSILTVIILAVLILNGCSKEIDKSDKTTIIDKTYEESHMEKEEVKSNSSNEHLGEVFPYEFTEEETALLQLLGKNNDIRIISFQAPKGTKAIEVKTAILNEEKEWVDEQAVSMLLDDGTGIPILSGELVIEILEDNRLKLIIDTMGRGIFYRHVDDSLLSKKFIASLNEVLSEPEKVTINQETPVFMATYDMGSSISAHQLKNYHDSSKLVSYDLVQGVTITFKDNLE